VENGEMTFDHFSMNYDWFFICIFADLKKHKYYVKFYQPSEKVISEEGGIVEISSEDFGYEKNWEG